MHEFGWIIFWQFENILRKIRNGTNCFSRNENFLSNLMSRFSDIRVRSDAWIPVGFFLVFWFCYILFLFVDCCCSLNHRASLCYSIALRHGLQQWFNKNRRSYVTWIPESVSTQDTLYIWLPRKRKGTSAGDISGLEPVLFAK